MLKKKNVSRLGNWKRWVIGTWDWKRPIKLLSFVYASLLIIALFFSNLFLFPYQGSSYHRSTSGLRFIESSGENIACRLWRVKESDSLILYFHGNAEDIGMLDIPAWQLNQLGYSVLSMDYRGYGLSTGSPSEENSYDDAEAVLLYAKNQLGYQGKQIIVWGRSLGGGVATELATKHKLKGLVLESAFSTAFRTATKVPILPFDQFNNLQKMPEIEEPLFIIHGENDEIIAPWHSQKLLDAHQGKNARIIIPSAGHNDLWTKDLSRTLAAMKTMMEN